MFAFPQRALALALALAYPMALYAQEAPAADAPQTDAKADVQSLGTVQVTGSRARLDAARNGLSPDTGSSITRLDASDIKNLPQGDATPLNQVILQTPGVVQDSYGQLHVRGDHSNIQYRINGVVIPESISGFGASLETRFADHLSILTGALPAQYGYRTAAVVDIQSKGETIENGGSIGVTLGTNQHREVSAQASGTDGAFSYYVVGSYLGSALGIENPTPETSAIHDQTHQSRGFADLSYVINDDSRVSLLLGVSNGRFEIPDVPGQTPDFSLAGTPPKDSATLDARQRERNRFAVLSYQGNLGANLDYQVSVFNRVSDVHYRPDAIGDLQYNGVSADILRRNTANGLQADLSDRINSSHTLRAGLFLQSENATSVNNAQVFAADADGNQTSDVPMNIVDQGRIKGTLWGAYLQDEWKLSKSLTFNYGARYDRADTVVQEHQLSPRLGLVYAMTPAFSLHAGYARYFTPPPQIVATPVNLATFAGTSGAAAGTGQNPVLPERSHYFDAGISQKVLPGLTVGVDVYYKIAQDLLDDGQFGQALVLSGFNYEKAVNKGVEFSATYTKGNLTAYGNVAMAEQKATNVVSNQFLFSADDLAYLANHTVNTDHAQALTMSGGASYLWNGTRYSANFIYGSGLRRDSADGTPNGDHVPAYTQVNVGASHEFAMPDNLPLTLRFDVVNLFDESYQLRDGSGIGVFAPQYGPRRGYFIGLSKKI
ncbi:MAG TPA: TonB-dependent receptor [Burkholderiaceae bacterium]